MIVEGLANFFNRTSSDINNDRDFLQTKKSEEKEIAEIQNNTDPINAPITKYEMTDALTPLKDTSPGPDNIPAAFLQHLPEDAMNFLLDLYNIIELNMNFPKLGDQPLSSQYERLVNLRIKLNLIDQCH